MFLVGVNAGFMEVGRTMGEGIAISYPWLLPVVGFSLGMVVVLAEPAVYVLTEQVEEVTSGHIKKESYISSFIFRNCFCSFDVYVKNYDT